MKKIAREEEHALLRTKLRIEERELWERKASSSFKDKALARDVDAAICDVLTARPSRARMAFALDLANKGNRPIDFEKIIEKAIKHDIWCGLDVAAERGLLASRDDIWTSLLSKGDERSAKWMLSSIRKGYLNVMESVCGLAQAWWAFIARSEGAEAFMGKERVPDVLASITLSSRENAEIMLSAILGWNCRSLDEDRIKFAMEFKKGLWGKIRELLTESSEEFLLATSRKLIAFSTSADEVSESVVDYLEARGVSFLEEGPSMWTPAAAANWRLKTGSGPNSDTEEGRSLMRRIALAGARRASSEKAFMPFENPLDFAADEELRALLERAALGGATREGEGKGRRGRL